MAYQTLVEPTQPTSLAEAMRQWQQVQGGQQQMQMNNQQMQLGQMQLEQHKAEIPSKMRLQEAQANHYQAQAQIEETKANQQKAIASSGMAKAILERFGKVSQGLQPGTPQWQQALNQTAAPFAPQLAKMHGVPYDPNQPIDANALESLAAYQPKGAQEYHPPVGTNQGTLQYGANGWEPIQINGQTAMPVGGDVNLQAQIAAAKAGQQGHAYEDAQGRKGYAPAYSLDPNFRNMADKPAPESQDIKLLMQQANGGDTAAAAKLEKIIAARQGSQPDPVKTSVMGQSAFDEAAAKAAGTNKAKIESEVNQRVFDANSADSIIKLAEPLLQESTNSGIGHLIDDAMGFIGKSTKGADAAEALKSLGARLTLQMPRMNGPQSDRDVQLYKEETGQLGNPTIPLSRKLKALEQIKALNSKYASNSTISMPAKSGGGWNIEEIK